MERIVTDGELWTGEMVGGSHTEMEQLPAFLLASWGWSDPCGLAPFMDPDDFSDTNPMRV